MSETQSKSPAGHSFAPRRPELDLDAALAGDWCGGSVFRTAWFNALSMLFPLGEKFFIDSVRAFRDQVDDPTLLEQITAFQGQEAVHRRQHQRYNETLCAARGYDIEAIETPIAERIEWANSELSARRRLAGTAANEHLTAILADDLLRSDDALIDADPNIAELWRWHAVEETEHKSVAYDVYTAVGGYDKERRQAMTLSTWFFFKDTFRILRLMLRHDGKLWSFRVWWDGLGFLFVKPGFLRRIALPWLSYFRSGFHPWQHDNRQLIAAWEERTATTRR